MNNLWGLKLLQFELVYTAKYDPHDMKLYNCKNIICETFNSFIHVTKDIFTPNPQSRVGFDC